MMTPQPNDFPGKSLAYLKDELDIVCHGYPIPICQGQDLVVVQHSIEVFDPDGVHGPITDDPLQTIVVEQLHGTWVQNTGISPP